MKCNNIQQTSLNRFQSINYLNGKILKLRTKSVDATVGKAMRRKCTAPCNFPMSFDDQFQRPSNCSQRIPSYQCVAQVEVQYNTRNILISFVTIGSEYGLDSVTIFAVQQVTYTFNLNISNYIIMFACSVGDDCDWTYARDIINRFTKISYTFVYNNLKSLLYDNTNTSVSQCYSQNNIINCNNGLCSSIVFENISSINRSCIFPMNNTEIDIIRVRVFSGPTSLDQSFFLYQCNRDLCNDPTTENSVQLTIRSNASLFDIPQPSKAVSVFISNANYCIVLFVLIHLKN